MPREQPSRRGGRLCMIIKIKSPDDNTGTSSFKANKVYLEQLLPQQELQEELQVQLSQLQSLQQHELVLLSLPVTLLAAYTEAPASIIAAVTPMINFFIVYFLMFN
jgi:hypothetical protein